MDARVAFREGSRDGAAERVADERALLDAEPLQSVPDVVGVGADAGAQRQLGPAEARQVDGVARARRVEREAGPALRIVEQAVQQDERPALARPAANPQ